MRWLMPEELADDSIKKGFGIGLHVPGTFDKVIDIHTCHIMPALGNEILETIRGFVAQSGLAAYHLRNHEGFWRFVMLRHSVARDQWMVNLVTSEKKTGVIDSLGRILADKFPGIRVITSYSIHYTKLYEK